ncbi:MAG: OmpA family protein [Candidatus Kapaibacterium sp.]
MKSIKILLLALFASTSMLISQNDTPERPEKYRLGLDLGLNYNFAALGYQTFAEPVGTRFRTFTANDGTGLGGYLGLRAEYISNSWWGLGLQIGYDNRGSLVTDESADNKPEFDIYNSYLNIAPYFKFNELLFKNSSVYVGPVIALKMAGEYDYDSKLPGSTKLMAVEATELKDLTLGAQLGFNYDIRVAPIGPSQVFVLSPFIEGSWLMGQKSATFDLEQDGFDDTWSTITARIGVTGAIDFIPDLNAASTGGQYATVLPPYEGKVIQRVVEESFPLIPYVFFDGSQQNIPARYNLMTQANAGSFDKADALDLTNNKELNGETATNKKLAVYHNILNIYAQEMKDDSDLKVELIGSAPKSKDGAILANNVRDYLVNIHGIDASRITTKGQEMPRIPSGSSATPVNDRPLADAENRRVEFVFNKPEIYELLKVKMVDEYPVDNDILVSLNPNVKFSSWNINIVDEDNKTVTYGPFFNQNERVSPYLLLQGKDEGDYTGFIEIVQADGTKIKDETEFSLTKEMDNSKIGERYTILFNYGQADAIKIADKDLRTKVAPKVDDEELLIISGHTDPIGSTEVNAGISAKRADEAKDIFVSEFGSSSDKVDNIISYGYGESNSASTYDNSLPEGRMYNRNVTIDIIPSSK